MKSNIHRDYSQSNICLVCGFKMPNNETIIEWSQKACRCCGADIGYTYDVDSGEGAKEYRKNIWQDGGFFFFDENYKPEDWNKKMALKQIKDNVPEEFL